MKHIHDQRGIALLELSIMFIGLILLVLGGLLLSERFNQFGEASRITDRYLHDAAIRPLRLEEVGGTFSIVVDDEVLADYIQSMVSAAAIDVQAIVDRHQLAGPYSVQMGYRVLEIDEQTGAPGQLLDIVCVEQSASGTLDDAALCDDLSSALAGVRGQVTEDGVSLYASPTAFLNRTTEPETEQRYLPFAVLVAMQVAWSVEKATNDLVSPFVLPEEAFDRKIAVLRGDIAL